MRAPREVFMSPVLQDVEWWMAGRVTPRSPDCQPAKEKCLERAIEIPAGILEILKGALNPEFRKKP